ncbi:MAG TPA: hypothetical protein ENH94_03140 [Phycisphaerales bacterium]|nr:hypothetical protein [Phycisphaerales bacterium]
MSPVRFPAFVGAWATGKTMCLLAKALMQSFNFPHNKGLILRENFINLKNSTMSDFTRYTGIKVPVQSKVVRFPNGSEILFSHADEVAGVVQNINLGWFAIEQAEEFASSEVFDLLDGRLRRDLTPIPQIQEKLVALGTLKEVVENFAELSEDERKTAECSMVNTLHIPVRQGFCIANTNGHNWMWRQWKNPGSTEYICGRQFIIPSKSGKEYDMGPYAELFEAKTMDNYDNLPGDFLASLGIKEETSPCNYRRFVENSWDDTDTADKCIPYSKILAAVDLDLREYDYSPTVLAVDPAEHGDDRFQMYVLKGYKVIDEHSTVKKELMESVGHIVMMCGEHHPDVIAIDDIGVGAGPRSRLIELRNEGVIDCQIMPINTGRSSEDPAHYQRLRDQIVMFGAQLFKDGYVGIPNDTDLIEELAAFSYEPNSSGRITVHRKKDIKKAINRSPDRADTLFMGLWAASKTRKPIAVGAVEEEEDWNAWETLNE